MKFKLNVLVSVFFIATAIHLLAQTSGTGAISGTVSDSSGAVIPGATVTATNADTGQNRTVTTGADGTYRFVLLPPGSYNLKFSANGFKTTDVPRVGVAVTETPVLDEKLELGTQSEQVNVEANAEAIQTTNAALGSVLGGTQVTALPLTTRNYTNILGLSAGVSASVTNASTLGHAGMNVAANGAATTQLNMQIDGANVAPFAGSGSNAEGNPSLPSTPTPNPDSLQEFKVQTSSYDAGYGRNAGANVNVITKSGTNVFHGSAFEFFRNTALNANEFFLNLHGTAKGVLNQNQFGGVLGGPIKKDKLFFFVSYQGTNQKNSVDSHGNASITLPPIPAGDRSNTAAFQAALGAALCPANHPGIVQDVPTRGGVGIACDGSTINPVAIRLLQGKFPNTDPGFGGQYIFPTSNTASYLTTNIIAPAYLTEYQGMGNFDYLLSSKHTISGRFYTQYTPETVPFTGGSYVPGFTSDALSNYVTSLFKVTSVLTPSLVNEARASYHRDVADAQGNTSGLNAYQFGVTALNPALDALIPGFLPSFTIAGVYTAGTNGVTFPSRAVTNTTQLADQISWTHGKHSVRAGFETEQVRWGWNYFGEGSGLINFTTFADFLIGRPGCTPGDTTCSATNPGATNGTNFSNISQTLSSNKFAPGVEQLGDPHSWRSPYYGAFVQDDLKVGPRLTVNIGLRWEYDGLGTEIYGAQSNLWPSAILGVPVPGNTPATGTLAGWVVANNYPGQLAGGLSRNPGTYVCQHCPPKDNFAPRFGFAWQPFGGSKFVVRGGIGYFYDRRPGQDWVFGVNNGPPVSDPATNTGAPNYYAQLSAPWRELPNLNGFKYRYIDLSTAQGSSIQQQEGPYDWITPLLYSWNLGTQWNFAPSWVLEVGYVGSHGIHQSSGTINDNSADLASPAHPIWGVTTNTVANAITRVPYLGFGQLLVWKTQYATKYHSLQVTLRKQFSHGFQAQTAFTWNRSMDDTGPSQDLKNFSQNYGWSQRPLRLTLNYSWNLPFGNPKGFLGKVVSGWNLSGVTTIQDGTPLTITDGRGGTIYNLSTSRAQIAPGKTYADIATPGDLKSRLGGSTGGCGYFTSPSTNGTLDGTITCASLTALVPVPLAANPDGTLTNGTGWGNMGQGVILGPGQFNFDAALVKTTKVGGIHEDGTLQFRTEFFNAFNHAQFGGPSSSDNSSTFGQISSTTVNPRLIQFALKYSF